MTAAGLGLPWGAPHFFVDPSAVHDGIALLQGDQARHLSTVLRARPGDAVSLADGTGRIWPGRVRRVGPEVEIALGDPVDVPPTRPALTVVHALPRGRKLDEVVEKLTEIGVDRIVPVTSERTQVDLRGERAAKAVRRWRAVALAAAKQSRRARLPEILEVGTWADAFEAEVSPTRPGVVLWEEATRPLRDVLRDVVGELGDPDALVLGIGPEGGLTSEEVAATGCPAVSLGPTILRTETAALVACTATLTLLGRLA